METEQGSMEAELQVGDLCAPLLQTHFSKA